ncbi:unnamed protein product [Rhizophagus irregularis]|nr:unnamed protein product [Rhizophagus irregularis]
MGFFVRFWTRGRSIRNFNKDKDNNKRNNTVESEKQVRPTSRTSSNNSSCILDSDGLLFGLNTLDLGLWKRRILTTWSPDAWKSFNFNSRKGLWKCWKFN